MAFVRYWDLRLIGALWIILQGEISSRGGGEGGGGWSCEDEMTLRMQGL